MFLKKSLVFILALLPALMVRAFDFSVTVVSGQTLYFNYVEGGVEVTHPSDASAYIDAWKGYDKPTGALTIPSYVTTGDTTYSVLAVGAVAFYGCADLTKVTVGEGVTMVDNYAFSFCTSVTELHLPTTLQSLGNQAFANMSLLADMWLTSDILPQTHTYTFYNTTLSQCTLHVGCSLLDSALVKAPWSGFGSVVSTGCKATITVLSSNAEYGTTTGSGSYDVGSKVTIAAIAAEGYHFVSWNDGDTLNPRIVEATNDSTFIATFMANATQPPVQSDTVYIHDTVTLMDTVYVYVPVYDTGYVHDTVYYAVTVHDTLYSTDTIYLSEVVHDTLMPTFFNLQVSSTNPQLGVGVGSALLPAGAEVEICGLPLEGARFVSWEDGSTDNPRKVTVKGAYTYTASFEQLGTTIAEPATWTCGTTGRRLSVSGVEGRSVRLYDTSGRLLLEQHHAADRLVVDLPALGVYLVQVDDGPARRVVAK